MKRFIFGNNALAEVLFHQLKSEGVEVEGFCLNERFITDTLENKDKFFSIEKLLENYGKDFGVYLVIGYHGMNSYREEAYKWLKSKNIKILDYIHKTAIVDKNIALGEGNIVLENVVLQPFVKIGDCNIIWEGCNISHHTRIGNFNYLSPCVAIAGRVVIGNKCFFGIHSTCKNDIVIGDSVLIGAGSYVSSNIESFRVVVPSKSVFLDKTSEEIDLD